jgi:hypothetical protein
MITMKVVRWKPSPSGYIPGLYLQATWDPNAKGWFAEIIEADGDTIYTTPMCKEQYVAICNAERWAGRMP